MGLLGELSRWAAQEERAGWGWSVAVNGPRAALGLEVHVRSGLTRLAFPVAFAQTQADSSVGHGHGASLKKMN